MNYKLIEEKHNDLIKIAKDYISQIKDPEHNINHIKDVVEYTEKIIDNLNEPVDKEVCIIGAYWHDVGRGQKNDGHEEISSKMIINAMKQLKYDDTFILKCSEAIKNHGVGMSPSIKEGLIIQDADKIAWIGSRRWNNCIFSKKRLDSIMEMLPSLRNELLHFECSRRIYDEEIVKLVRRLYHEVYDENILVKFEKDGLKLEIAEIQDLDNIIELYSARINWFKENRIDQWQEYLIHHPVEEFIDVINNKNYYILRKDNEIVAGFELSERTSFWNDNNQNAFYIYKVVTKVGYKNLGRYIFEICENFARKNNKQYLRLECKADNTKLNDMYEKYGFKFVREGQDYYNYILRQRVI